MSYVRTGHVRLNGYVRVGLGATDLDKRCPKLYNKKDTERLTATEVGCFAEYIAGTTKNKSKPLADAISWAKHVHPYDRAVVYEKAKALGADPKIMQDLFMRLPAMKAPAGTAPTATGSKGTIASIAAAAVKTAVTATVKPTALTARTPKTIIRKGGGTIAVQSMAPPITASPSNTQPVPTTQPGHVQVAAMSVAEAHALPPEERAKWEADQARFRAEREAMLATAASIVSNGVVIRRPETVLPDGTVIPAIDDRPGYPGYVPPPGSGGGSGGGGGFFSGKMPLLIAGGGAVAILAFMLLRRKSSGKGNK